MTEDYVEETDVATVADGCLLTTMTMCSGSSLILSNIVFYFYFFILFRGKERTKRHIVNI